MRIHVGKVIKRIPSTNKLYVSISYVYLHRERQIVKYSAGMPPSYVPGTWELKLESMKGPAQDTNWRGFQEIR